MLTINVLSVCLLSIGCFIRRIDGAAFMDNFAGKIADKFADKFPTVFQQGVGDKERVKIRFPERVAALQEGISHPDESLASADGDRVRGKEKVKIRFPERVATQQEGISHPGESLAAADGDTGDDEKMDMISKSLDNGGHMEYYKKVAADGSQIRNWDVTV